MMHVRKLAWIVAQATALLLLATCSPGIYLEECPDGVIVDGVCQPSNCAGRQCPEGFFCDEASGQCLEINCTVVECPEGQACANGHCYPKDCPTRTCPGVGDVCIDEECQPASCVGVECPSGQRCAQGQCYPVDCQTKVCPGQLEVCVDEECVEQSCVGVTCPEGQRCAQGNCYPAGCGDTGCFGEGEVCIDGVCQRTSCVDVECPADQTCANGWCYPSDCADQDCSDFGEVCYQDQCIHVDCVGVQCPAGEYCARGECFPLDCAGVTCEPPYVCVDGTCVRSNCVGVQCPPGQTCADGECLSRDCTQEGCAVGEVCVNNVCVPDDCAHVSCPAGEVCGADLQCHPTDCGGTPCGEYEVCVNGSCIDRLCIDVTCNAGEICVAGRCYDPQDPSCQPACGTGEVCEDGHCIPEECANWRCCPPFDCTEQNQCEQYTCDEGVLFTCLHDGNQPVWSDTGTQCTDLDPCTINDTCQADGSCQGGPMPCDQDEICVDGVCRCGGVGPDCVGNETCCTYDNNCYDLDSDLDNCGSCDSPCRRAHATPACVSGVCQIGTCDALWDDCNNTDADGCETSLETLTDCGTCGTSCSAPGATVSCAGGTCHITNCDPLLGDCDGDISNGCEQSLETLAHCNACNTPCARDNATAICPGGVCQIQACDAGWDDCDGQDPNGCENSLDSLSDCGACGVTCSRAHATASCAGDVCHIGSCDALWDDCNSTDADGCETSLETLTDCGACGVTCSAPGATTSCAGGSCHIANCDPLLGDCDGNLLNGCETSLETLTDCGACGTICDLANASDDCTGGTCHIAACDAGWGDCNNQDIDGCENSLDSLSDCGACGVTCSRAHATASCSGDVCHIGSCDPLWDDCNSTDGDGCETSLETLGDCGSCGTPCSRPNANADCSGGTCHIGSCQSGWGDCDTIDANGCENSLDSLSDCGACGVTCSRANATASCSGDVCHIASCNIGYDNCDGNDPNGCETNLNNDDNNCGSCGFTCNQNAFCSGGNCTCDTNYANCNGNWSDGCEIDLLNDPNNCGSCGNNCGQNAACSAGSCVCLANYANCDGNWGNGCEVDLLNDSANCGSCGNNCGANAHCSGGNCACNSLWGNCDSNWGNGCETALNTLSDCGSCGVTCDLANANDTCVTGSCEISSCWANYGNCDNVTSNGCEQLLNTLQHCGACNNPCNLANASETCTNFICEITGCNSGYWDIDNNDSTGCECGDTSDAPETCGSATNLGSISGSQSVQASGVIAHRTGYRADVDCYVVTFTASNPAVGAGCLNISLSGSNVNFNVWKGDCSTSVCTNDTVYYTECASSGSSCSSNNNGTFYVCVDVANAGTATCSSYTLTFTAGACS